MPTYQYECEHCGHSLEVLQSMTDKKLKKCPHCGKNSLSRLIGTGGGIIFKGTGFYQTDYKNKGSPSSAVKESKSETKEDPKTKPAARLPARQAKHGCHSGPGPCGCA